MWDFSFYSDEELIEIRDTYLKLERLLGEELEIDLYAELCKEMERREIIY